MSELEFIMILVKDIRPSTSIIKAPLGCCGVAGYVLVIIMVCNSFN